MDHIIGVIPLEIVHAVQTAHSRLRKADPGVGLQNIIHLLRRHLDKIQMFCAGVERVQCVSLFLADAVRRSGNAVIKEPVEVDVPNILISAAQHHMAHPGLAVQIEIIVIEPCDLLCGEFAGVIGNVRTIGVQQPLQIAA